MFRDWAGGVGSQLEVVAIQLPGRENRIGELPLNQIVDVVEKAESELLPLFDRPFAFFGHSYGAEICFRLARRLRQRSHPMPIHLFLSACRASHLPNPHPPIRGLSDEEFTAELVHRYNGFPQEVLTNKELLQLVLPAIRADFEAIETKIYEEQRPLDCPISALGGREDPTVTEDQLLAWGGQTSGNFQLHLFPGNHFYLNSCQSHVWSTILEALLPIKDTSRT